MIIWKRLEHYHYHNHVLVGVGVVGMEVALARYRNRPLEGALTRLVGVLGVERRMLSDAVAV